MTGKLTRRAALGLVATGSVISISESRSFSQFVAGRGVAVSTADDPDALLGLSGVSDAGTIPTFTNQSNDPMVVTLGSSDASVEFDVGNTGSFTSDPAPFDLAVGEAVEVGVSGDSDSVPVAIAVELQDDGETVGSIELQRDFAVSQAGQIRITPDVKPVGGSGKYRFELENTGDIDVTMKAISIVETTHPTAAKVRNGDILTVKSGNGNRIEGRIVFEPIPIEDTFVPFDTSVRLDTGVWKEFEFDEFQNGENKKVGMSGEDVKIRLKFTDDSTLVVDICDSGCDF